MRAKLHVAGLLLVGILLTVLLQNRGFYTLDEGSLLSISERVARGDVLYRDVCSAIFPGIYYLLATAFRIFGSSIFVERTIGGGVYLATCVGIYGIGRRITDPTCAFLGAMLFVLTKPVVFPLNSVLNYSQVSCLFGLFALLAAFRPLTLRTATFAGVLTAGCGLFKQNYGLFLVLTLIGLWARDGALPTGKRALAILVYLASGAIATAPALLSLAARGAWPEFWRNCVLGPVSVVPGAYVVPWAPRVPLAKLAAAPRLYLPSTMGDIGLPMLHHWVMEDLPLFIPVVIKTYYLLPILISIATIVLARRQGRPPLAATSVFNLFLYVGIFPRTDCAHLAALAPLTSVLIVTLAGAMPPERRRAALVALLSLGALASCLFTLMIRTGFATPFPTSKGTLLVASETARGFGHILGTIESRVPPNAPIFVAPVDSFIYYLSGRPNVTRFDYIEPVNVWAPQAREIVERLSIVSWVVASDRDLTDTFVPPVAAYAPSLVSYLRDNFEVIGHEVQAFDEVHLCRRRIPPPAPRVDLLTLAPEVFIAQTGSNRKEPAPPDGARVIELLLRRVLSLHPPEDPGRILTVTYEVDVPQDHPTLNFTLLGRPDTYSLAAGPGLYVRVRLHGPSDALLLETLFDPGKSERDRLGRDVVLDLLPVAGQHAQIVVEAQAPVLFDVRGMTLADLAIR